MKEKVIAIIEDILQSAPGAINEDTRIKDVPEWDSLAHVLIIGQLSQQLGIEIPLDEVIQIETVRDLFEKGGIK